MTSTEPVADLPRWRELRTRFALRQRLVELVSTMTTGGRLATERDAVLLPLLGQGSLAQQAARLNAAGHRTTQGRLFQASTVKRMLARIDRASEICAK